MRTFIKYRFLPVLLITSIFAATPALADKPEWAGKNKHGKKWDKEERRSYQHGQPYFTDHHRHVVGEYYGRSYRAGKCPRGLAKKHNGCLPPGQAKKWHVGQPLPHGVVYYNVPRALVIEIGVPPHGYKYVRVGADILMIAIGTRMVVDAVNDLGRM